MRTKSGNSNRALRSGCAAVCGLWLGGLFVPSAQAALPVVDVNGPEEIWLLYGLQDLIRENNLQNEQIIDRLGKASDKASSIVGNVSSVTNSAAAALAIETGEKAKARSATDYSLKKTASATLQADMKVSASFSVLGTKYERDAATYEPLAMKDALRARQQTALDNLSKVTQDEFSLQKNLLSNLRSAKTEAEIQLVHAGLAASQERVTLARQKVDQARDEYGILEAQLQNETERKRLADKEWNETLVEKLRARALTSLHAQKGENF